MKKFFIILSLFSSLLVLGSTGAYGAVLGAQVSPDSMPNSSITASPMSYDFGKIYPENGIISTAFKIQNVGEEPITIHRLSTSCGCTTAEMDTTDLQPDESRVLIVKFDPSVHPDQSGPMTRMVYLQTSDPEAPELEIELTGNVIREVAEKQDGLNGNENMESEGESVLVFFNEACQDCGELVNTRYPEFFAKYGYSVDKRDYINERKNRQILNEYNEKWDVPFELQSHIEAFIGEKLLIGGHVPEPIMSYLLEYPEKYNKLLVYQDKMHGEGTDYKVWDFENEIKTYPLDEPITTYFDEAVAHGNAAAIKSSKTFWGLATIITTSAFLDGINPCAIAVLLFFIAFLFSIKKTKRSIWKMGLVYIAAIYLAYLLIGIGIAQAIIISGAPHLMAYIGAYLVIALGVIQLLTIVFPRFPIRLRIPINTKTTLEKWLYKATLPAAFIGGFVVGLCTFPCSGGIYVAIIGMLAASQTYMAGLGWMIWYNLIFVLPLIILLLFAANPKTTDKLQKWERKESKKAKIIIGFTMIALGLSILFFFIE